MRSRSRPSAGPRASVVQPPAGVHAVAVDGLDAVRLTAAGLDATFVPRAGMVGASLRHEGEELLDRRDGVRAYLTGDVTMGIPFLHPWANRLSADRYEAAGRVVELPRDVPRDPAGLPIHGLRPVAWRVTSARAGRRRATLAAIRDFRDAAFPFSHRVEQRVTLDPSGLLVETLVRATGPEPVPVAFGFHPYLRLPGVPRRAWAVSLPARRRIVTDDRLIPTGARCAEPAETRPLGRRVFDDGYDHPAAVPRYALAGGGRRLLITLVAGYPVAQVFAPAQRDVVCFEPMTAPVNSLVSGDGLRILRPGGTFAAAFGIRVERTG